MTTETQTNGETQVTETEAPETPEVEVEVDQGDESDDKAKAPKELREHAKRQADENKALRKELMDERLDRLGLNANEGLGKAIAKEYDGAMDIESISAYARDEYGHSTGVQADAKEMAAQTDKLNQIQSAAQPVTPTTEVDPVAAAEARLASPDATPQDAKDSIRAKVNAFFSN